jgi:hypothetical protein
MHHQTQFFHPIQNKGEIKRLGMVLLIAPPRTDFSFFPLSSEYKEAKEVGVVEHYRQGPLLPKVYPPHPKR